MNKEQDIQRRRKNQPVLSARPRQDGGGHSQATSFEADFRCAYPLVWWGTLLGPLLLTLALLGVFYVVGGGVLVAKLVGAAVTSFLFLGRFIILGGAADFDVSFFTPWELFLVVCYLDLCTATLFVFHMGFLFRLPVIGRWLAASAQEGEMSLRARPRLRGLAFLALVVFIMVPVGATGSIAGTIFGRALGLSRTATFFAVAVGHVLGAAVVYLFAAILDAHLDHVNPWLSAGGVVVIVGLLWFLHHRYRLYLAHTRQQDAASGR